MSMGARPGLRTPRVHRVNSPLEPRPPNTRCVIPPRLPDCSAVILKQFADIYHREPTPQETHELVAQILRDTSYEISCSSVKRWFYEYRRRGRLDAETPHMIQGNNLNLGTSTEGSQTSQKRSQIRTGETIVAVPTQKTLKATKGGGRRIPVEGIAILKKFATEHGRYPSAAEKRELVERIRKKSGFQTTVETMKWWFYAHRTEFNLKTLVDFRTESLNESTFSQVKQARGMPKKSGLTIRLPPRRAASPSRISEERAISTASRPAPHVTSGPANSDHSLSRAHVEILRALQIRGGDFLEDSVIIACSEGWAVDRCLIEDWLQGDQTDYVPPTPTSPLEFTPVSFLDPLTSIRGKPGLVYLEQCQLYSREGEAGEDSKVNETSEMLAETGDEHTGISTPHPRGTVGFDSFVDALIETIRESLDGPPRLTTKSMEQSEFMALWPLATNLADVLGAMQTS